MEKTLKWQASPNYTLERLKAGYGELKKLHGGLRVMKIKSAIEFKKVIQFIKEEFDAFDLYGSFDL
jgi:hypothetical protein